MGLSLKGANQQSPGRRTCEEIAHLTTKTPRYRESSLVFTLRGLVPLWFKRLIHTFNGLGTGQSFSLLTLFSHVLYSSRAARSGWHSAALWPQPTLIDMLPSPSGETVAGAFSSQRGPGLRPPKVAYAPELQRRSGPCPQAGEGVRRKIVANPLIVRPCTEEPRCGLQAV